MNIFQPISLWWRRLAKEKSKDETEKGKAKDKTENEKRDQKADGHPRPPYQPH